MRIAAPATLDLTQRNTLQQWAKSRSLPTQQVERARTVLLAAEGKADLEGATAINPGQPGPKGTNSENRAG